MRVYANVSVDSEMQESNENRDYKTSTVSNNWPNPIDYSTDDQPVLTTYVKGTLCSRQEPVCCPPRYDYRMAISASSSFYLATPSKCL